MVETFRDSLSMVDAGREGQVIAKAFLTHRKQIGDARNFAELMA